MNGKSKSYSVFWKRNGLTLVEVVAGLMLMSSLLVGILTAYGRHIQQTKRAQKRLEAVAMADRLLTSWAEKPDLFFTPLDITSSESAPTSGLYWTIHPVDGRSMPDIFGAEIVRLAIYDAEYSNDREPLVAVELVRSTRQGNSAEKQANRTTRD